MCGRCQGYLAALTVLVASL